MKASELRIGNWLNDGFFDFQVEAQDILIISDMPEGLHIKPIPLTEEWLMKFGFELIENASDYQYARNHNAYSYGSILIYIEKNETRGNVLLYVRQDKALCTFNESELMRYVHQLQNFCFAFTGEELTLNTKTNA